MLCSCSIDNPGPAVGTPAGDPGTAPSSETLPASARLVPEPVDSVEDVPGRYVQPFALPGQVSTITIDTPSYGMGSYQLYRSCGVPNCVPETGSYDLIATNPAIGFAALTLVDQAGAVRATYILDYLWRDDQGALVAIQLRALLSNGPGPTQVWWRLPSGAGTPTTPASRTLTSEPASPPPALAAPAPAPSLDGVFVRALPVYGDIGALTLHAGVGSPTIATGAYHAAYPYCLPWCLGEDGRYELDLDNATTGTGHLALVPSGNPEAAHDYIVYAIWRAPDGTPAAIQLQRVDGVTPSGPPFTLYRQWWTGSAALAAPDVPATCTAWLALAGYYRIRALQCGMSACWALAPWYSAWAQYYDALAAAQGCTPAA